MRLTWPDRPARRAPGRACAQAQTWHGPSVAPTGTGRTGPAPAGRHTHATRVVPSCGGCTGLAGPHSHLFRARLMPRASRGRPADRAVAPAANIEPCHSGNGGAHRQHRSVWRLTPTSGAGPSYPPAAIDWLLPEHATRVLDLGAGTGKLTRQLRERGLDVIAVEPSAGMREQLRRAVPGVPVLGGKAEQLPLAAGSVDAILVAQAWHWVEPSLAIPEAARVLAPVAAGRLWNRRVEGVDWVSESSLDHGKQPLPGRRAAVPADPRAFRAGRAPQRGLGSPPLPRGDDRLGRVPQLRHHLARGATPARPRPSPPPSR